MNIVSIESKDAARWEAYVNLCPRATPAQSYDWFHMLRRNYEVTLHALAAEDAGEIVGILPLYQVGGQGRLISSPYAVNGGLSADSPAAMEALLQAAIALVQRLGAPGITFKQYRWPIEGPVRTDDNWRNREVALTQDERQIWAKLDPRNRAAIEAADKRRLTLEFPSKRVDRYFNMLLRFMTRLGTPCPSRRWIDTLLEMDLEEIAIVLDNGRPLAATMVKPFKWMVSFPFTCLCDNRPETLEAAYFMYWELIKHYKRQGSAVFHSGRMPKDENVPAYRRGWGGDPYVYYYQYYPAIGGTTELGSKRGWKRRLVTAGWKWLPLGVARALGPKIVARFP